MTRQEENHSTITDRHIARAQHFAELGRPQAALEAANHALASDPTNFTALLWLGHSYSALGLLKEAATVYRQALALNPSHSLVHSNLGHIYYKQGFFAAAEEEYNRAITLQHDNIGAWSGLATLYDDQGRDEETLAACTTALNIAPHHTTLLCIQGRVLIRHGDIAGALRVHEYALAQSPQNHDLHNQLGVLYEGLGREEEARQSYHNALRLDPNCAVAHYRLGRCFYREQAFTAAEVEFTQAIACRTHQRGDYAVIARAEAALALVLLRRGENDQSYEHILTSLALADPSVHYRFEHTELAHLSNNGYPTASELAGILRNGLNEINLRFNNNDPRHEPAPVESPVHRDIIVNNSVEKINVPALQSEVQPAKLKRAPSRTQRPEQPANDPKIGPPGLLAAIGRTPLVKLTRLSSDGVLYLKLERANPNHSWKDRRAFYIIDRLRAEGRLAPGQPVVATINLQLNLDLAWVCAALGHPFILVASQLEQQQIDRLLLSGVEICKPRYPSSVKNMGNKNRPTGKSLSEETTDWIVALEDAAQEIARNKGAIYLDLYHNLTAPAAYTNTLGAEIIAQLKETPSVFLLPIGDMESRLVFNGIATALRANYSVGSYVVLHSARQLVHGFIRRDEQPPFYHKSEAQNRSFGLWPMWDSNLCTGTIIVDSTMLKKAAHALTSQEGFPEVDQKMSLVTAGSLAYLASTHLTGKQLVILAIC